MSKAFLETERLRLNSWSRDDFVRFKPIATDPEVMRYISGGIPWTDEGIRDFIDHQMRLWRLRKYCFWALERKTDSHLIGFCGLQPWRKSGEIEIGWWLAKDCWKQGLATEAARVVLSHGLNEVGLGRIIAVIHVQNTASQHVAEKLGLAREKTTELEGFPTYIYANTSADAEGSQRSQKPPGHNP